MIFNLDKKKIINKFKFFFFSQFKPGGIILFWIL
jgi:hypothetical protein